MIVAVFTDGSWLECTDYEARDHGVAFLDADDEAVAYAPYHSVRYVHDEAARLAVDLGRRSRVAPDVSRPTVADDDADHDDDADENANRNATVDRNVDENTNVNENTNQNTNVNVNENANSGDGDGDGDDVEGDRPDGGEEDREGPDGFDRDT